MPRRDAKHGTAAMPTPAAPRSREPLRPGACPCGFGDDGYMPGRTLQDPAGTERGSSSTTSLL